MEIDNDNRKLAKEKVNFLTKVFFYEDPKKAMLKGILFFVFFALLGFVFLVLEMSTIAIVFGVFSIFFLVRIVEKFVEWRKER